MSSLKRISISIVVAAFGICLGVAIGEDIPIRFSGQGWSQVGRIGHVTLRPNDSLGILDTSDGKKIDVGQSWMQSLGAQISATADLAPGWEGAFGIGVVQVSHSVGKTATGLQSNFYSVPIFKNFLPEARLTYYNGVKADPSWSLSLGNFSYKYAPDVKDLGLYLTRGPVYPGLLMGSFQDFSADSTKSNVMGAKIHAKLGELRLDGLLINERELPPTFDWSAALVAKYNPMPGLELGAGVNFYRLIPYKGNLESPAHLRGVDTLMYKVDPVSNDTVYYDYTHQGTKLMAMTSLDFKALLGLSSTSLGPNDLKLYSEIAVLGVKNYAPLYSSITKRIPVMAGVNLPAFGWLDYLSIEVEWFGSPYRNDIGKIGYYNDVADWTLRNLSRPIAAPVPVMGPYADSTRDNWKWAIYAEKKIKNHIQLIGQIADDHYRPPHTATGLIATSGGTEEAFTTPADWYFMFRAGYTF